MGKDIFQLITLFVLCISIVKNCEDRQRMIDSNNESTRIIDSVLSINQAYRVNLENCNRKLNKTGGELIISLDVVDEHEEHISNFYKRDSAKVKK